MLPSSVPELSDDFVFQLISSGRDSTIRTWKPDLKAAVNTVPEDQLPPPVEYFSNQVVRLASGNVTALSFSRKGMLASGSDDHVVSLWHLDSITAMISVIWTSRGKIDVHDGMLPKCPALLLIVVDPDMQGWCHACHGVVLPVRMYCFLAVLIVPSR